jgi:hypothetical protein
MSSFRKRAYLAIGFCILSASLRAEPRYRVLLVGIDDYSARRLASKAAPVDDRDFPNLEGAVNDVELMHGLLTSIYKIRPEEIVILRNQGATRDAILGAIDVLVRAAERGDVILFYFSGHGSQVRNSLSEEEDRMDESIVPADTRRGAPDIRDKELRRYFRPLLDRGARLTIILDSCHSGSGARGLPGGEARFAPPDMRDVKDGYRGPKLEDGGALVLSAAQDTDIAFETRGYEKRLQGVFSWAWARAVRDAAQNEPAIDTFHRAAARMRLERPGQVPVIAGNAEARFTPFLGVRKDRETDRVIVSVRSIDRNGLVTIHGGWANGLTPGSELRPVSKAPSPMRLQVIVLEGMTACTAKIINGRPGSLHSGSLLELVAWVAPQDQPLRVWVPQGEARTMTFARALRDAARRAGVEWVEDPTAIHPARIIGWDGDAWRSLDAGGRPTKLGPAPDASMQMGRKSLFVRLPASPEIARHIARRADGVERVAGPQDADYILAGRLSRGRVEYAWIRPSADVRDERQCALPLRTEWHDGRKAGEVAAILNEDLRRLLRIHKWETLPSPPETQFNYRLGIKRTRDNALVTDGRLVGDEQYGLVLRAVPGPRGLSSPRYVYVFTVDTYGKSVLLFPRGSIGSVENRFPRGTTTPPEIRLGAAACFVPEPPYGTDTYFLLSTDEALTDPWILEWDGVRTRRERGETPLERLLLLIMSGDRAPRLLPAPTRWSIERLPFVTEAASPARKEAAR